MISKPEKAGFALFALLGVLLLSMTVVRAQTVEEKPPETITETIDPVTEKLNEIQKLNPALPLIIAEKYAQYEVKKETYDPQLTEIIWLLRAINEKLSKIKP